MYFEYFCRRRTGKTDPDGVPGDFEQALRSPRTGKGGSAVAEFEEKLNAILGNPEAMEQIVSMAKALSGGSPGPEEPEPEASASAPPEEEALAAPLPAPESQGDPPPEDGGQEAPDLSGLFGLLGGLAGDGAEASPLSALGNLDPRLIQGALTLFSEYNAADDRKTALLAALKPFVRKERYAKVDRAIQIARLSRVIRTALRLFRQEGGAGGV